VTSRSGRVLVLNAGSATLKATILDLPGSEPRFDKTVDWPTAAGVAAGQALGAMFEAIGDDGAPLPSIVAVGHRVVHGGERFTAPVVIDDATLAGLDDLADLAPLHNPMAVDTIHEARRRLPGTPQVAAFDTAFHATLPVEARRYPIPDDWVADYGIRRYGFHGLSVEWSIQRSAGLLGRPAQELRLVVAHLGGGCSVTAVDAGRSIDTSMGLTPLEGLMMTTRAGSIDPGIVFHLGRAGVPLDEIERRLEHGSGLAGVGGTGDMRTLLARESEGDRRAALAISLFVRRAAAGIAAAATALPALDGIVFTGGIGEHAATVRSRICGGLGLLAAPTPTVDAPEGDAILARGSGGTAIIKVHAREDIVIANAALAAIDDEPAGQAGVATA
jgi:acetate kinase